MVLAIEASRFSRSVIIDETFRSWRYGSMVGRHGIPGGQESVPDLPFRASISFSTLTKRSRTSPIVACNSHTFSRTACTSTCTGCTAYVTPAIGTPKLAPLQPTPTPSHEHETTTAPPNPEPSPSQLPPIHPSLSDHSPIAHQNRINQCLYRQPEQDHKKYIDFSELMR